MLPFIAFHILIMLAGLAIATRIIPAERVRNVLGYLHNSIGITAPSTEQVRTVALIWIGSVIVMVDGCLFLLVFIAKSSAAR